jgi:plastocyanin
VIESTVMQGHLRSVIAVFTLMSLAGGAPADDTLGTLEGRVRFEGSPPPAVFVPESGLMQQTLYVNSRGGLQYVVVYLPDMARAATPRDATAHVDQRQFVFVPPVIAVRGGQPVRFTNSDAANHNVRSADHMAENTFALDTSAGDTSGKVRRFAAPRPSRPVRLSCDIHPWMAAWVYAFDHDSFAVTDVDGRFRIAGVPSGRHRVAVRQPAGRLERDLSVDLQPGGNAPLDVRFTATDVGLPTR